MSVHPRKLRNGRMAYDVKLRDPAGRQYSRTFRTPAPVMSSYARRRSQSVRCGAPNSSTST